MYSNGLMRLWLTNSSNKKSWITATVVLFNTQVKTNILASWWIMMTHGSITKMKWWNKLTWILCWTLPKVYAVLSASNYVNHGKRTAKYCRGPVFTSLLWNVMLFSRVMIFKAAFYTLYTTHQMGSNGRISVINKKQSNALIESWEKKNTNGPRHDN